MSILCFGTVNQDWCKELDYKLPERKKIRNVTGNLRNNAIQVTEAPQPRTKLHERRIAVGHCQHD